MQSLHDPAREKSHLWQALCQRPLWRPEDLGRAIPASLHATSVAMPLWEHVIGYEKNDPAIVNVMEAGYPRFVFNRRVNQLLDWCMERHGEPGEKCLVFPSERSAAHCAQFLRRHAGASSRMLPVHASGVTALFMPEAASDAAKKCWQHYGRIVCSRLADTILEGRNVADRTGETKSLLRERIAGWTGMPADHVFLYPTGMATLADSLRAVQAYRPGMRTLQIGFPYVDLLKIQHLADDGVEFLSALDDPAHEVALRAVESGDIAAVFCEAPGNPLLGTPDLPRLSAVLRQHGVPLVVDETLATYLNVDLAPYADLIVTSLTKYVSGIGDAMAGCLVVNPLSPMSRTLHAAITAGYEDLLWCEEATALELNSRDFPERMRRINATTEVLCDALRGHAAVERVYFPKYECAGHFEAIRKPGGGYGGLFSLTLDGGAPAAEQFYNRLQVSKGPSLGMNYTMACPFVILAHYDELEWAESHGVPSHLVRVSVGLEEPQDLIARFNAALANT